MKKLQKIKPVINYDSESDVLYIANKESQEEECIEIAPGINAEIDEKGKVIGFEILNASSFLKPVAKSLYRQMQMPAQIA